MTPQPRIREDIEQAFRLEELKTFRLQTGLPYALVSHNSDVGLISDLWLGSFGEQEEFRAVLDFIATQFEGGGYALWLADLRYMSSGFGPSGDWLVEELMPRVFAAGLAREVVVLREDSGVPEGYDVFGSATEALRRLSDGRVRGFTDIEAARRWLFEGVLPHDG